MKTRFLILALLAMSLFVAAACGDDDDTSDPTATATTAGSTTTAEPTPEEVVQEGKLVVGWSSLGNESLSPVTLAAVTQDVYLRAMYDHLVRHERTADGGFEEAPGIAESWEQSADGLTWTFHIREGVTFHNGDPLTADDVKFSLEQYMADTSTNTLKGTLNADIDTITVVDPQTVDIKTAYIIPQLPLNLADIQGSAPILPKAYYEEVGAEAFAQAPIGSGPFKFVSQSPGSSILFEALPEHWRGAAKYKELEFRILPETSTRVNALLAGEVDFIDLPIGSVSSIDTGDFDILEVPGELAQWLNFGGLWPDSPTYDATVPWTDPKVREAMNIAIDREAIVDSIFSGYAQPASIAYWNKTDLGFPTDAEVYPYDPERARTLLAEAGYPDGFPVEMLSFNLSPAVEMTALVEAISLMWGEIGLDVTITPTDFATMRTAWSARELKNTVWPMRGYALPDRTNTVPIFWSSTGTLPIQNSPELDTLVSATTNEPDLDLREPLITDLIQTTYDDYSAIPGVWSTALIAHRKGLEGWEFPTAGFRISYEKLELPE